MDDIILQQSTIHPVRHDAAAGIRGKSPQIIDRITGISHIRDVLPIAEPNNAIAVFRSHTVGAMQLIIGDIDRIERAIITVDEDFPRLRAGGAREITNIAVRDCHSRFARTTLVQDIDTDPRRRARAAGPHDCQAGDLQPIHAIDRDPRGVRSACSGENLRRARAIRAHRNRRRRRGRRDVRRIGEYGSPRESLASLEQHRIPRHEMRRVHLRDRLPRRRCRRAIIRIKTRGRDVVRRRHGRRADECNRHYREDHPPILHRPKERLRAGNEFLDTGDSHGEILSIVGWFWCVTSTTLLVEDDHVA